MTIQDEIKQHMATLQGGLLMLNARPEGMSYPAYKELLKAQKKGIEKYKGGQFIYVATNRNVAKKGISLVKKNK